MINQFVIIKTFFHYGIVQPEAENMKKHLTDYMLYRYPYILSIITQITYTHMMTLAFEF